ncbi:MAG: adenylate/guanylate cyclase domain-containing protein [Actinomycetota bacterium]|nr:adenylate/guanylate cyclase domain-containing protein [Actinomycetota bacterium]
MEVPDVQYTKSGDVNIAYQVTGEGPFDLVFAPGYVTHLEIQWTMPAFAPFLEQMSSFCRLIRFDKRGTGMSDRVSGAPTLETRMDDVRAVMDAVGSQRAAFFGLAEGAAMTILFAASYPDRTAALVVRSAFPRRMWAPDYPWGSTEEQYESDLERALRIFGPREQGREAVRALGRFEDDEVEPLLNMLRYGSSPGAIEALHRMNKEIDIRHVLPAVRVPTLILHGSEDTVVPLEVARYMVSRIPTAQLVEIPGAGHLAFGKPAALAAAEIERFVKEVWEAGGWEEAEPERVLATVLFTDIVGSTAKAAELGDRAWRELLEHHHALIRRQLVRFRGAELDVAGDGFFARFDGPARAIRCACAITEVVRGLGLEIRAGLHTGECEVMDGKVGGIAVHIGARVAEEAQPGEVLVSSTVKDLVAGSGLRFRERGSAELKGVPEEWRLYAVERSGDYLG